MTDTDSVNYKPHKYLFQEAQESMGVNETSGRYDTFTHTINSDNWAGRNVNFSVTNTALNRLIIGHKCYLRFRCTATQADGITAIPPANKDFELREEAGSLIIRNVNFKFGGVSVHDDSNAHITRHFYERLTKSNACRLAGEDRDRYIYDDSGFSSTFSDVEQKFPGYDSIIDNREFHIVRPLDDITFFGINDTPIPASIPIYLQFNLSSRPDTLFKIKDTLPNSPKLHIIDIQLFVYSVEISEAVASAYNEKLRTGSLTAMADTWGNRFLSNTIESTATVYNSNETLPLDSVPDIIGVAFFPNASLTPVKGHHGHHSLRTSWLNIENIQLNVYGNTVRTYNNLGTNNNFTTKTQLIRELDSFRKDGTGMPIDKATFMRGDMSFFPICNRSIDEYESSETKPYSLTFIAHMRPNAGDNATGVMFYKTRNKWMLDLNVGGIKKI